MRVTIDGAGALTATPSCKLPLPPKKQQGSSKDLDGDGEDDGDYKCVGSLLRGARRFTVFNGAGAEVGEINKQGRFSSMEGYVRAKVTEADKYTITVKPGTVRTVGRAPVGLRLRRVLYVPLVVLPLSCACPGSLSAQQVSPPPSPHAHPRAHVHAGRRVPGGAGLCSRRGELE